MMLITLIVLWLISRLLFGRPYYRAWYYRPFGPWGMWGRPYVFRRPPMYGPWMGRGGFGPGPGGMGRRF